ncbi:MAG: T9SS type A sorting domain-containing protein [Lutibacter sp.]
MKRLLLIIWISIVPLTTFSQVTTVPSNPTDNEEITILFDATGTSLDGYTGDVYAFTGVTVNGGQFSNVLGDWGDNVVNPQLTRDAINLNLYTLLITPTIFDYYGVSTSDNITELVFIFRSADATIQTNPDIFVPIIATNPPPVLSNWGIVGTATPNGWDGADIPLTYDAISNKWSAVVSLTNGEIKFRNDNNWIVNYGDNEPDGILDRNGANITIAEGYYLITSDFSTLTYAIKPLVSIPDPNFEQALIDLGIDSDGALNGMILKENVVNIDSLSIGSPLDHSKPFANPLLVNVIAEITDLTGIEAFTNLKYLSAGFNNINRIDLTQNTLLEELWINDNGCSFINVSNNPNLKKLGAYVNNLTALDLSNNPLLTQLYLAYNPQLKYLDIRNGNNNNISAFWVIETPNLTCINADTINSQVMIDSGKTLNENCGDLVYIPDTNFEQSLIDLGIDTDGDINSLILKSDAEAVIDLDINDKNISSLAGIEHFVNLTNLYCNNNKINVLDLSSNTKIIGVLANQNFLTAINISNCPNLVSLHLWSNQLTSLNVKNNVALKDLILLGNNLTDLDVSNNPNLTFLQCNYNQLTNLNIANGNNANFIPASWINLSFAAEGNPDLKCIQADVNIIGNIPLHWLKDPLAIYSSDCVTKPEYVFIPDPNFEQALIDLGFDSDGVLNTYILKSDASLIIDLDVNNKNISSLAGIEHFVGLRYLYCNNNLLTEVNLGDKPNLTYFDCGRNALTSIDVSNYPNLVSFNIWDNQLTALDVSNNPILEDLICFSNKLTTLDISLNTKLKFMHFANNKLVNLNIANGNNVNFAHPEWADYSFDARNNPALMCIQVDAGIINNIPADWFKDEAASYNENCPIINCEELVAIPDANFEQALIDLGIDTNGLTGDILKCDAAAAIELNLNEKNISSLAGIEYFVGLRYLYCYNNLLTEVNLGDKPNLINLDLGRNALINIDVSNYPNLVSFSIWNNQLTTLDVSNNPNLEELICFSNKLTTLDVSANSKLKFMNFSINKLVNLNIANGNNINVSGPEWADYSFSVTNNPGLSCIQVDENIIGNIPSDWFKDETASYNTNCPIINCDNLVAIPDVNFEQALVDLGFDTNGLTGDILKCDAAAVIDLDINNKNISSLAGIEHFVNLRYLFCNNNKINELDLSSNSHLMGVLANQNFLTTINISNCPNLVTLHLWSNQLTSLNVENNVVLKDLILLGNNLTNLDVSNNPNLTFLQCNYNQLTSLNIANGNNVNFSPPNWTTIAMNSANNPNLTCIQVDEGIINNIPSDWLKDEIANYSSESCESSPILYVNDNNQSGDLYTTAIGSNANPGTAALPFATIQHAINKVAIGGVIYVDAGIFMEDVVVNKGVTLNAVQAGVNPESSLTRGAETVVMSATADPINRSVFILQSSDITIDGFTIDGDNPTITGAVLLNGSDINAGFGIAKFIEPTAHKNLNIRNNIIKNFYRYGVFIQSTSELPLSGNLITQNHFNNISAQNVDGNYGRWGRGIGLFGNAYASISQNVFTKVSTAILVSNFDAVSIDNSYITGNTMETYRSGIFLSGFSEGANHYEVYNNHISTGDLFSWNVPEASTTNNNIGINASSISNTTGQSFHNNTIINTRTGVLLSYNISSIPGWAIQVNNNSITETIGYAIQNSEGNKVNAICNWYGSTAVQDNLDKVTAQNGYFAPFLTNGTDTDPSTNGFQPVPDSCNGWPLSASVTSKTDVTCFEANNGSINISIDNLFTGKAPYTYLWTKDDEPEFSSSVEDPINLSPGTYRVTITDDWGTNVLVDYNGNVITIEVDINEPEVLTASANVINNICFAGNTGSIIVTAIGGTAPYSYLWSNGGTEDQIGDLTAGIYSVLITDANGCTSNTQYEVTQPTQIVLQLTDLSTACSNIATVSALGGTGGYTYLWSNGATSAEINAVAAGTYNVIVTDTNGCTMSGSITLAVKEAFNPSASVTNVSCFGGADGSITIGNVNGQAPFYYSIDGVNFIQNQNQFTNLLAGIYTIGVRDANGCTGFVTKTISAPLPIVINVDNVLGTCSGINAGSISISTSGGLPGYSYSWIGPNGYLSSSKNISSLAPGTYSITVSDTKNCSTTTSGIVVPTTPEIIVNETVAHITCKGETNGSINLAVSGGSGNGFYYSWSVVGTIGNSIGNLTVGNYNVTITDIGTGCALTKSYTITQPSTNVSISVSKINATGCNSMGKITITASGGTGATYSYKLDSGSYGSNNVFDNLQAGTYVAWVKDSRDCTNSQTVIITDNGSDAFEGNNSKNQAKSMNTGATINARIGSSIDVDWFKFVVPTGGGNYILNVSHETVNYTFNLYSSVKNTSAISPINQTSTSKEFNLITGTYYVEIVGALSLECYDLSVNPAINSSPKNDSSQTENEIYGEVDKQDELAFTVLNAIAYPNPSSLYFTLKIQGMSLENVVNVNVYDVLGRLVFTKSGSINDEYRFGEEFLVGVYLVKVQQGTEMVSLKVIKK